MIQFVFLDQSVVAFASFGVYFTLREKTTLRQEEVCDGQDETS